MKVIWFSVFLLLSVSLSAQDYKLNGNEVVTSTSISFKTGTATITAESEAALQTIKKYLDDKTYISLLRVEGHTDNSGDAVKNQSLSEKRALAVCAALVKMGVDCKRLIAVGFGGSKPVAANDSPEGKAANNRITFVNAALRGHAIGGMPVDGGGRLAGEICN